MHDLMARLGNPHHKFSAVHVTGTKGKGSVCALLEAALHSAGVRVGRYASPHIFSVCERVSLGRRDVDYDVIEIALGSVLDAREDAIAADTAAKDATWFDAMTAAAFLVFAQAKVDWAIVEVGLGGRLDSTNVVDGKICVITNVALEHTDVLGNSLAQIATEKAGITKTGSVVVTTVLRHCEAFAPIALMARTRQASLITVGRKDGITKQNIEIAGVVLNQLGALGVRQSCASPIVSTLLDEETIRSAKLPGRIERTEVPNVRRQVTVVLDGAHVDIALLALVEELRDAPWANEPMVVIFALGKDKNPRSMLAVLSRRVQHVIFTCLDDQICWEPEELAMVARELNISSTIERDLRLALEASFRLIENKGWILATGSLYLVGPMREALREHLAAVTA